MRENRKEKILDTAARYFSKYGYANTSLEEVAVEVGVTKPAIYYHFRDKSALYESVLLVRLRRLADRVERAVETVGETEEKLRIYIETFGSFLQKNSCFAAILCHEFADNGQNMPDSATRELSRTLGIVTAILNEGVESGTFEVENPMVIQMMIVSTLIMHQTTKDLRKRVATQVGGDFRLLPEPDMENLSRMLAGDILKLVRKGEMV
ncbi:TetR/AcrR family transcriptional regulator [Hydrogenimonas sp.]